MKGRTPRTVAAKPSTGNPAASTEPLVVNGWTLFAHPLFRTQVESLAEQVHRLQKRDPAGYVHKTATKRLAAIERLAFDIIPGDPTRDEYRQGLTLGEEHRHWRRAKFFQQYRLFFRFHAASRILVYAWVNDTDTRRVYGSPDDAYRGFSKMLVSGHPPDDWEALLDQAKKR